MGNTSYLYNDYIKDLAGADIDLVDAGGSCVDSNYPITALQDEQIADTTRTDAKVAVKLQFDLGSTKQLQAFFIGNHNFSGGTFDINSYTANDYVTGKTAVEANKTVRLLDVYHYESSAPAARRYWEFDFTNTTTSDSVFEIGRAMVYDDLVQFTDKNDYIKPRGYGFKNIINKTAYDVRAAVHKLMKNRERFELKWGERTIANSIHTELRTLYETVYGDAHPFVFIPDITGTPCYYVYIESPELLWAELWGTGTGAHVGGFRLKLIEAVRGKA